MMRLARRQTPQLQKAPSRLVILPPRAQASRRCETQAPLSGKPLSCASVSVPGPLPRAPGTWLQATGRRTAFRSEQRTGKNPKTQFLDRKSPIQVRIHLPPALRQPRTGPTASNRAEQNGSRDNRPLPGGKAADRVTAADTDLDYLAPLRSTARPRRLVTPAELQRRLVLRVPAHVGTAAPLSCAATTRDGVAGRSSEPRGSRDMERPKRRS